MPDLAVSWLLAFLTSTVNIIWSFILNKQLNKAKKAREEAEALKKEKEREQEDMRAGLKAILHTHIYTECERLLKQGWATSIDKKNLEYLYKPYEDMGGNGTGKHLFEATMDLPTYERTGGL